MTVALVAQPADVDLELYQGDDFTFTLTVTDNAGNPANLTGATFLAQIRSDPTSTTLLASFGVTVATNVVTLALAHADAAKLPAVSAWDCQMTDAGGHVKTLAAGTVTAMAEVSR